ncbi:ABC transporter ATP-binding protein [Paenibacillus assamensis]|uniref:ABC transporter ATP-binding protein n=1 Tax=Paenibacillus assamensis TaxID=311244 RepID=UPI00042A620B|nr:ABC transporter ATP-binding protein [Paenibacillus assamensis]
MIEVHELFYTYPGSKQPLLQDMNFQIGTGEIFGLLGPSGAGKSTTQKVLIGMLKDYTGSVKVLGGEIASSNRTFYEKIGVAFEFPNFYMRLTARENLQMFRSLYSVPTVEVNEALRWVSLEDYADRKVQDYSKGMKMRLNLARSLMHHPPLLFLDEPTSGLDPTNAAHIKQLMIKLKEEGRTIVLTTHNMALAEQLCDRVAFVVDGKIRLIDTPARLMKEAGQTQVEVKYAHKDGRVEALHIPIHELSQNRQFHSIMNSQELLSIHSHEMSLEQLFIRVTGRALHEAEQ